MSQRIGWRSYVSPLSSLLTSIYGVWNAETTSTTLATSVYSAWNGEGTVTATQLTASASNAWNAEGTGTLLDASIYSYWSAENVTTDLINGNNGTLMSGATFSAGKIGKAFSFNGSSSYLKLPNNSLNFTGDFSISCWVNVSGISGWPQYIYAFGNLQNSGSNYFGYRLFIYGNGYAFDICNGTTTISGYQSASAQGLFYNSASDTSAQIAPVAGGAWKHIVITRKAGTGTKMYINGVLKTSNTSTVDPVYTTTHTPSIGAQIMNSGNSFGGPVSSIDLTSTWTKELSADEVLSLYNFGNAAEYPYSTKTLPSAKDSIGAKNGTLMNGAAFTTGKLGISAFSFDGVNDYVALPNNSLNLTGDFSISFWYYTNVVGVEKYLISSYNSDTSNSHVNGTGFIVNTPTNNKIGITIYNTGFTQALSNTTLSASTWYHVAITRKSGTNTKIYINGVLDNTVVSTKDTVYNPVTFTPSIGNTIGVAGGYVNGRMDSLSTWSKELTSDEISALYNSGTGQQYPFSTVTIGTANDSVSTNNGTINSGVTYAQGVVGNAFKFNGTTGYVSLPDNSLNLTGDFTISVWVYPTSGAAQTILANLASASGTISKGWSLGINNISGAQTSKVIWWQGIGPATTQYTGWEFRTTSLTLNAWNHILITRVSGVNTYCEVNGILQTQTIFGTGANVAADPTYHTTNKASIGAGVTLAGVAGSYLLANTMVDNISVWNRQLTSDEKAQLYNMGGGIQYPFTTQTIRKPYSVYNGDDLVDPIGAKNATIVGGVTYTTGKIGNAYTFDGSTGYLTLPANSMRFAGSLSISMWVYPTVYPTIAQGQIGLISNTSGGYKEGFDISLYNPTGNVSTYIQFGNGTAVNGGYAMAVTPAALPLNTWTLLTVTFEAGVGLKAYYNGVLQASVSSSVTTLTYANMPTTYTPTIGYGSNATGPNYGVKFAGQIDGLTFWNSALTAPEVITLFNDGTGMEYPYSSTLPAKLPSASDAYGSNTGTLMNGCSFTGGKIGKAFLFDGVNDYVNFNNDFFKPVSNFSANFWINTNNATTTQTIFTSVAANGYLGWRLFISGGVVTFRTFPINTTFNELSTSTSTYTASNWHMITIINDITNGMKIYVNGVQSASNTIKQAISWGSTTINKLGQNYDNGTVFNGKIDAMTLWTKALTSTEVTNLYNSGNGKQYPNY